MSSPSPETVTCPKCNHQQKFVIWKSMNVTLDPELKAKFIDGTLTTFTCEAIRTLEMLGVIDIRPGEGTFVRSSGADDIIRPLAMFLAVERSSILDMFEMRRVFETATAGLAAERASSEEIDQIHATLESMKERLNVQDPEKGQEFDAAFHYAVAEATHNSLLIKLFKTVSEEFVKANSAARRRLYHDSAHNAQRIIDQHSEIFEAIRSRSPLAASKAMLEHLLFAEGEMRKWIV